MSYLVILNNQKCTEHNSLSSYTKNFTYYAEIIMFRVATYARFSSDNQNEKSIDDQQRNCHIFSEQQGWNVVADFKDMALQGKLKERPGYIEMMKAAQNSKFDILIVDDLSRLSRGSDVNTEVEKLKYHGVRLITVGDGIDSNNKSSKMHIGMKSMMNNLFLDDLKDKVHRGQMGNALNGKNTGGKAYGYYPVAVRSETELDIYREPKILYSDMVIDDEQAKWIRQIYEWVAETRPYIWIANELNRLKVPTIHGGTWTTSTLCGIKNNPHSGILNNPIYIGKKYWNRSETVYNPETGKATNRPRDENEWVISERPDLRIIDDSLWSAVKKEQERRRNKTKSKHGKTHKAARSGPGSKFILSGILKCSNCGADYITIAPKKFGCRNAYRAGESVCTNKNKIDHDKINTALLGSIQNDLFLPEVVEEFRKEVVKLLKLKKKDHKPAIRKLDSEIKGLDNKISKLLAFIVESENPPKSIATEITNLEQKQEELTNERKTQSEQLQDIEPIIPRAVEKYHNLVKNMPSSCEGYIPPLRAKVSKLLGGEVIVGPKVNGEFEGTYRGSFSGLLGLVNDVKISDGTLKPAFLKFT